LVHLELYKLVYLQKIKSPFDDFIFCDDNMIVINILLATYKDEINTIAFIQ